MIGLNEIQVTPRFNEIDAMQVVHHAKYLSWLEEARFSFSEQVLQISKKEIVDAKIYMPVVFCDCNYKNAIKWGDVVTVRTHMHIGEAAYFWFYAQIFSSIEASTIYAEGRSKHIFTDSNLKMLLNIPKFFFERVDKARQKHPYYFKPIV